MFEELPNLVALSSNTANTTASLTPQFDIIAAGPVETAVLVAKSGAKDAANIARMIDLHLSPNQVIPSQISHLPFFGGAIGIVTYGYPEQSMGINRSVQLGCNSTVGIYNWAVIVDHSSNQHWLVGDAKLADQKWKQLIEFLQWNDPESVFPQKQVKQNNKSVKTHTKPQLTLKEGWQTSAHRKLYQEQFSKTQRYILDGDCYQVNLTRQFSAKYQGSASQAFISLSEKIGESYSALLQLDRFTVASFSPERFIQIHGSTVTTEPIKGTRKRSEQPDKDKLAMEELMHSAKDQAENLMIVDLMRNDLGKHCVTGSVKTLELFSIASYANVHHLVSKIQGEILDNSLYGKLYLFLDSLPGGSITGAPKIRAMQILAELEKHDRACYCGSLFYLSSNGNLDSNIMIRSLLFDEDNSTVYCWGGGGIVADSNPDNEFEESYYKVSHILAALENND